jgi:hypothetical protein
MAELLAERGQYYVRGPWPAVDELPAAGALEPGDLIVEGGLPEAECLGGREDAGVVGDDQKPVQATPGAGPDEGAEEWAIEEQIPGISALMEHYDASLGTIRRAQDPLVAEGLLRREQGRGVFVAAYPEPAPAQDTARELIREAMSLLARASSLLEHEG